MEPTIGMRVRAARFFGGYGRPADLAKELEGRGLGQTNIYAIEQDRRTAQYRELVDIADACRIPVAFFTADFSRLSEISEDPRAVIARETAEARQRSEERREGQSEDRPPLQGAGP